MGNNKDSMKIAEQGKALVELDLYNRMMAQGYPPTKTKKEIEELKKTAYGD